MGRAIREKLQDYALAEAGWLTWLAAGYSAGGLPLLLQSAVSFYGMRGVAPRTPKNAAMRVAMRATCSGRSSG